MDRSAGSRLAVDGGTPVRAEPFPPWPVVAEDEEAAALRVLRSGRVSYRTGEEGRAFEDEFSAFCGTPHAVALANGTLALELALLALGVGPGDEVVVPARTFIASASCVVARGATPVVADVDRDSQTLTAGTIAAVLTQRTRAVIPVHLAGWPCDMEAILDLARERNLCVVEDCAQALGAAYRGKPVGSFGHANAFSFCQDKIMTTAGEGGMLVTVGDDVWERAWSYKDHGTDYAASQEGGGVPFRWVCDSFGTNWRLTELQAAVGRVALRKVPEWVGRRRANAARLQACFSEVPALRVPVPGPHSYHAFYKFYAFVHPELLREGWTRDRVGEAICAEGVPAFSGACPEIYRERAFVDAGFGPAKPLPVARELGETALMFLVHHTLGESEIVDTCAAVTKVMEAASR